MDNHHFEMAESVYLRTIFLRKEIKINKSSMWYRGHKLGFSVRQVWFQIPPPMIHSVEDTYFH